MKILVVDDDPTKSASIRQALSKILQPGAENQIVVVRTLSEAMKVLSEIAFDLLILDLMLPYIIGGEPTSRAGLELLRVIRSQDGKNRSTIAIGVSSYPDEVASLREQFLEYGVAIATYDENGAWARSLEHVISGIKALTPSRIEIDFLIVCALDEERDGYLNCLLEKVSDAVVGNLSVRFVRLINGGSLGAILRLSQMGLVCATLETASALYEFNAKIVCMSGICAGISKNAQLGQLVFASPAWEYQAGKWSKDGFQIAPVQIPLNARTRTIIDLVASRNDIVRDLERYLDSKQSRPSLSSRPILAPFATGSAVIADKTRLDHIKEQHRKIAAFDMETFGLYCAAHEAVTPPAHFFSVKCVVDFADQAKGDELHSYGSHVSARAVEMVIAELLKA